MNTTMQQRQAQAEQETRIADAFGIHYQPNSRPYRRDFELWIEASEHQRGRMDAWARFRGGLGDGIEPYSTRHSDAWRDGYWSVAAALRTRWAFEDHRIDRELGDARQVLSAVRYAYHQLGTVTWLTMDAAYERVAQLTSQQVAWRLRMLDFVI